MICDNKQTVTFDARKGSLVLTGHPYWYAWRRRPMARKDHFNKKVNQVANGRLRAEFERDRALLTQEQFLKKYSQKNRTRRYREIYDEIVTRALVVAMHDYSARLSRKIRQLGGINPAVYGALVKTMRFSAFFRHAQKRIPRRYQALLESLARVKVLPRVKTPTVMKRPPMR